MGYVIITNTNNELYHFGIPGMKWGVRRYQNKDGSLTDIGKKRYNITDESTEEDYANARKQIKKDVKKQKRKAALVGATAAIGTAIVLKKKGISVKTAASKAAAQGKDCVSQIFKGLGEGVKEGLKEGPKKVSKYAVTGLAMVGGYQILVKSVGKSVTEQIFKANNPKNVDKFYKTGNDNNQSNSSNRDDDDDDKD